MLRRGTRGSADSLDTGQRCPGRGSQSWRSTAAALTVETHVHGSSAVATVPRTLGQTRGKGTEGRAWGSVCTEVKGVNYRDVT